MRRTFAVAASCTLKRHRQGLRGRSSGSTGPCPSPRPNAYSTPNRRASSKTGRSDTRHRPNIPVRRIPHVGRITVSCPGKFPAAHVGPCPIARHRIVDFTVPICFVSAYIQHVEQARRIVSEPVAIVRDPPIAAGVLRNIEASVPPASMLAPRHWTIRAVRIRYEAGDLAVPSTNPIARVCTASRKVLDLEAWLRIEKVGPVPRHHRANQLQRVGSFCPRQATAVSISLNVPVSTSP